jgi:hypothetical protein
MSLCRTPGRIISWLHCLLLLWQLASNFMHRSHGHSPQPSPSLWFILTQHCSAHPEQLAYRILSWLAFPTGISSFTLIHSHTTLLWVTRAIVLWHFPLVVAGCNKVVFFGRRLDSNPEVSQHLLSFVGSNLSISSSISSLICVSPVLCGFPGFNLHRHQSTPRHPLPVACSNDSGRLGVSWWGYTRRILWTVRKSLFHLLPVFPWCPVCWTFANRFHTPNPCPHVWLWFRR